MLSDLSLQLFTLFLGSEAGICASFSRYCAYKNRLAQVNSTGLLREKKFTLLAPRSEKCRVRSNRRGLYWLEFAQAGIFQPEHRKRQMTLTV
jgi:hypothetical protein